MSPEPKLPVPSLTNTEMPSPTTTTSMRSSLLKRPAVTPRPLGAASCSACKTNVAAPAFVKIRSPLELIASTSVRPSRLKSLARTPVVTAAPSSAAAVSWLPAPAALSHTSAEGTAGVVAVSRPNARSARPSALKSPEATACVGPVASVPSSVNAPAVLRYTAASPSPFASTSSGRVSPFRSTSNASRVSPVPTACGAANEAPEPLLTSSAPPLAVANTKSTNASPLTSPTVTARLSTLAAPMATLENEPLALK